jgi:hypothetical protein
MGLDQMTRQHDVLEGRTACDATKIYHREGTSLPLCMIIDAALSGFCKLQTASVVTSRIKLGMHHVAVVGGLPSTKRKRSLFSWPEA